MGATEFSFAAMASKAPQLALFEQVEKPTPAKTPPVVEKVVEEEIIVEEVVITETDEFTVVKGVTTSKESTRVRKLRRKAERAAAEAEETTASDEELATVNPFSVLDEADEDTPVRNSRRNRRTETVTKKSTRKSIRTLKAPTLIIPDDITAMQQLILEEKHDVAMLIHETKVQQTTGPRVALKSEKGFITRLDKHTIVIGGFFETADVAKDFKKAHLKGCQSDVKIHNSTHVEIHLHYGFQKKGKKSEADSFNELFTSLHTGLLKKRLIKSAKNVKVDKHKFGGAVWPEDKVATKPQASTPVRTTGKPQVSTTERLATRKAQVDSDMAIFAASMKAEKPSSDSESETESETESEDEIGFW
jgi:hypothetical protein